LNLDSTLAHPLDGDTMEDFASTLRQVTGYMADKPYNQCGNIACAEKIKNTYSLVVAKTSGFVEEDRWYAESWEDMFNNRFYRVDFHQFHQMLNNLELEQPPSECLKKLLTELFPAPMHLRAFGPLPSNHFLENYPDKFVFNEQSMNGFFPLDDDYFLVGWMKLDG
jgi:hypothetical protein